VLARELQRPGHGSRGARVTKEGVHMNWDQIAGQWRQAKGQIRAKWAKLTDDDVEAIAGRKDVLVGRLQERYGHKKEDAEREVDSYLQSL
jgi:uncharacterized protein YjbJ (UPF0337 family)